MKKIGLALIGAAVALTATPVLAGTVVTGPYKNHGDCNSALAWAAYDMRKGLPNAWPDQGLTCEKINNLWYIVLP
jgi:hypothetical protein